MLENPRPSSWVATFIKRYMYSQLAGHVKHSRRGSALRSEVRMQGGEFFRSRLQLDDDQPLVKPEPEWIAANDKIYWRNGVYDRAWYNGDIFNGAIRTIPPADTQIKDETHWARFVKPSPQHVLRYEGEMELVVSPWYNV